MEDGQDFVEASVLYINDAVESLERKLLIRAALSCLCAAECLVRIGHHADARRLYLETAIIYEENADRIIGESVRESLWSLQEAYENFLLAFDYYRAQQIFDKYVFLARKLNPFFGEGEAMELLRSKKTSIENIPSYSNSDNIKNSSKLYDAIEKLSNLRLSSHQTEKTSLKHAVSSEQERAETTSKTLAHNMDKADSFIDKTQIGLNSILHDTKTIDEKFNKKIDNVSQTIKPITDSQKVEARLVNDIQTDNDLEDSITNRITEGITELDKYAMDIASEKKEQLHVHPKFEKYYKHFKRTIKTKDQLLEKYEHFHQRYSEHPNAIVGTKVRALYKIYMEWKE
jgi:hypothetical protein